MASRCCREGPGVGWRGGILLCAAHCNMFAVSHPKHVPFSARRSCCSQTGEFLGQASCAGLHGRTVTGSRAWAWWRARGGGRPRWVRMHRGSSYATQMSPGSLVRRGGWGGGEKCVFMGCNVFPSPSHPIHSTAAAALSHGYWTSFFVIDP